MPASQRRSFLGTLTAGALALFRGGPASAAPNRPPEPRVRFGRRIVTGLDPAGRSHVAFEGRPPAGATWKFPRMEGVDFWVARAVPVPAGEDTDPVERWTPDDQPPPGGIIGRMVTWQPGLEIPRHTTRTLDFGIIVSGQLELGLDAESRMLRPGDVVVQRGTAHRWRVPGPEPCTMVVIMIDAQPAS